jgi:hypothetical protein
MINEKLTVVKVGGALLGPFDPLLQTTQRVTSMICSYSNKRALALLDDALVESCGEYNAVGAGRDQETGLYFLTILFGNTLRNAAVGDSERVSPDAKCGGLWSEATRRTSLKTRHGRNRTAALFLRRFRTRLEPTRSCSSSPLPSRCQLDERSGTLPFEEGLHGR